MSLTRTLVIALSLIIVFGIGLAGVSWFRTNHEIQLRGAALTKLPELTPAERAPIARVITAAYQEYRANSIRWSGVYFGCVFGSALFSALAGLILKFDLLSDRPRLRSDSAAICAMVGALLVTLSTAGDFQRKWRANREAAAAMESLSFDLIKMREPFDQDAVVARMQAINAARTEGIIEPSKLEQDHTKTTPPLSSKGTTKSNTE